MLRNSYLDKRLQKGFLPDVAGCLEHSSLLSDALRARDARAHKRSICISWLDLKNAFGSVRHSLIIFALQYYGFPEHFIQLVRSYYDHLSLAVAVPGILSTSASAIHFALGVFQGCTLSPTLFNIIVQLALDSIEMKHCGYQFSSDPETVLQSSAYADDIQLVTSLAEQNQCAQWPIGYGVGLRIKRSSVRIRPWPLRWVLGQGSLLPLSQGETFTLASISYLAILVKYILAKKKNVCWTTLTLFCCGHELCQPVRTNV